jgi:hypothetical protein
MKAKKTYFLSNNWLWVLYEDNGINYFIRYDQIPELNRIERKAKELEEKTINDLKKININTIKENPIKGGFVEKELKLTWQQYLNTNYYLDPTIVKHIANR